MSDINSSVVEPTKEEIVLECEVPEGVSSGEIFHVKSPGNVFIIRMIHVYLFILVFFLILFVLNRKYLLRSYSSRERQVRRHH